MKYLYIILAVVVTTTILSLYLLWPEQEILEKDILFTINGENYTRDAIISQYSKFGYHSDNTSEMITTAISRELLIQEAQKQDIDKETDFRTSLKDYYENGLIKILLDRKNDAIQLEIADTDIDKYISFLNTQVTFTQLDQIPKSVKEATSAAGLSITSPFNDLAMPIKLLLSSLSPGSFKIKFDTGNEQYAVRLDKIQPIIKEESLPPDREIIRRILADYKREQIINKWHTDLRDKAAITIHNEKN